MAKLRIDRDDAICVAVDFQSRIFPAMHDSEELGSTVVRFLSGMRVLGIPTLVTQQYTKGLGETIEPVAQAIGEFAPIEKTTFSCMAEPEFVKALEKSGKHTVIMCGIEAHICVEQTAIDLLDAGYKVYMVGDCVQSRDPKNKECMFKRVTAGGGTITNYESVLYELLGSAKAPEFKQISAIVK